MDLMITCEWFALCSNKTDQALDHPILGLVPCCTRCAEKVGAEHDLVIFELV